MERTYMLKLLKNYINGRSCEILGLGVSNLPLAEYLVNEGLSLTVRDKKSLEELGARAEALLAAGAKFDLGTNAFEGVDGELIFRSPGIRPDKPFLTEATDRGAELTSEMELFLSLTPATCFAVTGSDGKTTTTTLTGLFLTADTEKKGIGRAYVGGNIGEPLLHAVDTMTAYDRAALELSSFQLMRVKRSPEFAAITNISPNHLDWHTGMDEYIKAKLNIVGENTRRFVTNADSAEALRLAVEVAQEGRERDIFLFSSTAESYESVFPFEPREGDRAVYERDGYIVISDGKTEERLLPVSAIRVPGRHNVENFMCAIALTYGEVEREVYAEVAQSFTGVKHRLELVRTLDGVDYFNSSIDSSPSRTAAALSALHGRDIVIICGGYDKNIPYEPLAEALCRSARTVILTGATAKKIEAALISCKAYKHGAPEYLHAPDLESAVKMARDQSNCGGCVLLSPASASFDAFPNFAVRGEVFRKIVENFEEN